MSYDGWKCRAPEELEEPEREPGCECAGEEHGTDCPEFEPPTAECECYRLFTHDVGCPARVVLR